MASTPKCIDCGEFTLPNPDHHAARVTATESVSGYLCGPCFADHYPDRVQIEGRA